MRVGDGAIAAWPCQGRSFAPRRKQLITDCVALRYDLKVLHNTAVHDVCFQFLCRKTVRKLFYSFKLKNFHKLYNNYNRRTTSLRKREDFNRVRS